MNGKHNLLNEIDKWNGLNFINHSYVYDKFEIFHILNEINDNDVAMYFK